MGKMLLSLAGALAALAVLLGAFGAHGLKAKLTPEMMAVYQTAVQYHTIGDRAHAMFPHAKPQVASFVLTFLEIFFTLEQSHVRRCQVSRTTD